jgi:hypothetical protein
MGEMPDPAADFDVYRLTTCYAAGHCQGDLSCPGVIGCYRRPDLLPDDEDGYDDEGR